MLRVVHTLLSTDLLLVATAVLDLSGTCTSTTAVLVLVVPRDTCTGSTCSTRSSRSIFRSVSDVRLAES